MPLTRAQYASGDRRNYPLPPKLFSHNDQQSVWQSQGAEGSTVGWGGNLGDLALSSNATSLFTCISASGNAVFLAGDQALQYQISPSGAVPINGVKSNVYGSSAVRGVLGDLVQAASSHVLEAEYARVTQRSISAEGQISAALAGTSLSTAFPANNALADQLKVVARLIAARGTLGTKRQVFFVSLGGFDLHDNLIATQQVLLDKVSSAMTAFYNATAELGVADKVTAFTASDFGRTLTSNGDGSDHGWGSHHFVVGGAVRGAAFYGTPPPHQRGQRQRQRRPVARGPGAPAAQHRRGPVRGHARALVRRGEHRAGRRASAHRQFRRFGVSGEPGVHGVAPHCKTMAARGHCAVTVLPGLGGHPVPSGGSPYSGGMPSKTTTLPIITLLMATGASRSQSICPPACRSTASLSCNSVLGHTRYSRTT